MKRVKGQFASMGTVHLGIEPTASGNAPCCLFAASQALDSVCSSSTSPSSSAPDSSSISPTTSMDGGRGGCVLTSSNTYLKPRARRKRNITKGRGTNLYGRQYCPGRPLSLEERSKIINLFHAGMKVNAIAKQLCISHGCVSKIITRFRETGLLMPSSHSVVIAEMKPQKKVKNFKKSESKQLKGKPNRQKAKPAGKKVSKAAPHHAKDTEKPADQSRRSSRSDKSSSVVEEQKNGKSVTPGKKHEPNKLKRELEDAPEDNQQNAKKPRLDSSEQKSAADAIKKKEGSTGKTTIGNKFTDEISIKEEEQRRRQDRSDKSLFIKGVAKKMNAGDLKALHPGVVAVRILSQNAWLVFASESACAKAYDAISAKTVDGKPIDVDRCGALAKNTKVYASPKSDRPVDFFEIVISGLAPKTTKESLQMLFPQASKINVVVKNKSTTIAFVRFEDKQLAREAFANGASLMVAGVPVDVSFARKMIPKDKKPDSIKNEKVVKLKGDSKSKASKASPPQVKHDESNSSGAGDAAEEENDDSSEEGLDDGSEDIGSSDSFGEESGEEDVSDDDSNIGSSDEGIEETSD
uniref:Uncharacterized protein n=1 Tax=Ditylenchus dipsaci TaxID=166011 RepID=A0A915DXG4_9BILA